MPRQNNKAPPANFTNRPSSKISVRPTPAVSSGVVTVPSNPMPVQNPSFGSIMKEGFAFGVGSSVARNVVDRIFAPPPIKEESKSLVKQEEKPRIVTQDFILCMEESKGDYESCKQFM